MLRKIIWSNVTGEIYVNDVWHQDPTETTIVEDTQIYASLAGVNIDSLRVAIYRAGEYKQDFEEMYRLGGSFRMNQQTGTPEFTFPDPNAPSPPTNPTYQKPLTVEVSELKQAVAELTMMMASPPPAV